MSHREQFRRAALASNLPDDEVSRFLGHLRLSIRLGGLAGSDGGAPVGRFGGSPRLPVEGDRQSDGFSHLPFIFSLDCAALPRVDGFDLPVDGSLLFFLDHEQDHEAPRTRSRQYARVVHIPAGTETAVAAPSNPELVGEQYDVSATLVASLPDGLTTDEEDMTLFQQQLARELRSDMPHLDELCALADELWPSSEGLPSGYLGGYPDDEVIRAIAERIINGREREKIRERTLQRADWRSLVREEQRRVTNEWTSLATFLLDADLYFGRFSIRHDDLAAGRLDKALSLTRFTE
ncbi:DUF1963 domain-containing protein [Promicromonospora iranensis]|uniref:DUF1963 domain-containing protein n=1 Tax=Promicromonospora iranensis TaxID=1105144 RepID=UPI0023A91EDA|nr:DUF1963 domain-containing protein [Promicromonospora iranensis]